MSPPDYDDGAARRGARVVAHAHADAGRRALGASAPRSHPPRGHALEQRGVFGFLAGEQSHRRVQHDQLVVEVGQVVVLDQRRQYLLTEYQQLTAVRRTPEERRVRNAWVRSGNIWGWRDNK